MDALASPAHVIVEKPITAAHDQVAVLLGAAADRGRVVIEDYNYSTTRRCGGSWSWCGRASWARSWTSRWRSAWISWPGRRLRRSSIPHPCASMPGGADRRLLAPPGIAGPAFVGAHRAVRTHWWKRSRGIPPALRRVPGRRRRGARDGLPELQRPLAARVVLGPGQRHPDAGLGRPVRQEPGGQSPDGGPPPLARVRDRLREARDIRRAARRNLLGKFNGPGDFSPGSGPCWRGPTGRGSRDRAADRDAADRGGQRPGGRLDGGGVSVLRVLVTGAGGFLGRHVVAALLRRGHQVRCLIRPSAPIDGLTGPIASRSSGPTSARRGR